MGAGEVQISLTVPAARGAVPSADTRPARVREWVDMLPYAHMDAVVSQLHRKLFALNRCSLKPQRRYSLMELIRPAVRRAFGQQREMLRRTPMLRLSRMAEAAAVSRRLAVEMAYGYKLVVHDALASNRPADRNAVVVGAICRAICYLSDVLVQHYVAYTPYPGNIWKELHQLYAYAERHNIEQITIPTEGDPGPNSVVNAYKQILLTSLADSYSLTSTETWTVYRYLDTRAALAKLTDFQPVANPLGHFLVDLNSDRLPTPITKIGNLPGPHDDLRLLNGRDLAASVRDQLVSMRSATDPWPAGLDETLGRSMAEHILTRMVAAWGLTKKRRFGRYARRGWVDMVIGLGSVHVCCNGEPAQRADIALDELEADDLVLDRGGDESVPGNRGNAHLIRAEIINESAGGLGLAILAGPDIEPAVGQLIGVRNGNSEESGWAIGVVRRIYSFGPGELEMGIQYLTPTARAVTIRLAGSGDEGRGHQPALLYANEHESSGGQVLITPRGTHAVGGRYSVYDGGSKSHLKADRAIESTPYFDHFAVGPG